MGKKSRYHSIKNKTTTTKQQGKSYWLQFVTAVQARSNQKREIKADRELGF